MTIIWRKIYIYIFISLCAFIKVLQTDMLGGLRGLYGMNIKNRVQGHCKSLKATTQMNLQDSTHTQSISVFLTKPYQAKTMQWDSECDWYPKL